jgi:propanediol dehydratase small subunit
MARVTPVTLRARADVARCGALRRAAQHRQQARNVRMTPLARTFGLYRASRLGQYEQITRASRRVKILSARLLLRLLTALRYIAAA